MVYACVINVASYFTLQYNIIAYTMQHFCWNDWKAGFIFNIFTSLIKNKSIVELT